MRTEPAGSYASAVTPDPPRAIPGFDSAETFSNRLEFGSFFRRLIPMLVMLVAITWLILGLLMAPLGLGGLRWLLALVLALGFGALVSWMRKKQLTAAWSSSTLQLSPFGAVASDRYTRTELPWSGLREVGPASLMDPLKMTFGPDIGKLASAAAAASSRRTEEGLVGDGSLTLSPDAPVLLRKQVAQNDQPGRPRAIVVTHFDPDWRAGRIGQWVRAYRPDLMA